MPILVILILISPFSSADWAFKAYRGEKVHLEYPVVAYDSVLLMVDQDCLSEQRRLDKHHRDPIKEMGFEAQHNISVSMRHAALAVRALREEAGQKAAMHPCVIGMSPNERVEASASDPLISKQAALPSLRFSEGDRFFRHPIWGVREFVNVGVIDTGIEAQHPELARAMWIGPNGERGWDFVNNDADASDDSGHGTHVSGILAAQSGNGIGIRGLADSVVRLMPVKSQDSEGGGNMADVVNAIRWAIDHGAEVLNLSLTSRMQNPALEDAIQYGLALGVVAVAASGNDGEEVTAANFMAPIGYAKDYLGLLGVGSIDAVSFKRSSFSNYSPTYVEMAAPGSAGFDGIFSTFLGGDYRGLSGTSMAAPHVAGAAALVIAYLKTHRIPYTPDQVESFIQNSAVKDLGLNTAFVSGRRLDLERLGRLIFNSTVIDSTGGFDEP